MRRLSVTPSPALSPSGGEEEESEKDVTSTKWRRFSLDKLNKHYGSLHHAVKDVDLEIADKEFVALVGPSGCGKSTTLRHDRGLEDISGGEIRIGGKVVNHCRHATATWRWCSRTTRSIST